MSGDNKCKACGQWSGRGHKCPPVTLAVTTTPPPHAPHGNAAGVQVDDRVARARAAINSTPVVNVRELGVQVDDRLAELYNAEWEHQQRLAMAVDGLHRSADHKKDRRTEMWDGSLEDAIAHAENSREHDYGRRYLRDYRHHAAQIAQIRLEKAEADAVYRDHQWTRAFLVINANGHVHKDMNCSTCFPTTRYEWLTAYSGADENEIVGDAGEMACTVCYPSAPAEVLNRPANLVSRTRAEKDAARAEREAAKAERERKRIEKAATANGEPLWVPSEKSYAYDRESERGAKLTSEVTAISLWTDIELEKTSSWSLKPGPKQFETQRIIAESLAAKHGRSVDEQVAILTEKARAKAKRQARG